MYIKFMLLPMQLNDKDTANADLKPDLEPHGLLVGNLELDGNLDVAEADFDVAGTTHVTIGVKKKLNNSR
jgi:hypothetical protein